MLILTEMQNSKPVLSASQSVFPNVFSQKQSNFSHFCSVLRFFFSSLLGIPNWFNFKSSGKEY